MPIPDLTTMLPFFLVLAIVYGALEVSKVFQNKGVKAIIAVVIAFFSISSPAVVEFLFSILPYAALFFIAFFFLGFISSFLKGKEGEKKDVGLVLVVLALVLIFLASQQNIIAIGDQNLVGVIVLLVVVLILYAGYQAKGEGKNT